MAATLYQRRKWQRRAETIHRRSSDLFHDMMEALGAEHPATDDADNLMEAAATLAQILGKDTLAMWASPEVQS